MFRIDKETKDIYCTRGDRGTIQLTNKISKSGSFSANDRFKFSIVEKNNYGNVLFQKEYVVLEDCETFAITLTEEDTRFYELINKDTHFNYEIEYNNDNTIIGYHEYTNDRGRVKYIAPEFILLPEAADGEVL